MRTLLSKFKKFIPMKVKITIKKTPSYLIWLILVCFNRKKFEIVDSIYLYEAQRLYKYSRFFYRRFESLIFKNYYGYCVLPSEYVVALDIKTIEKAIKYRQLNLIKDKDLLVSEVIKYAHAIDKGLHMPNKRKIFGGEKSMVLESLLETWVNRHNPNHPIYRWAMQLLFNYWEDQNISHKIKSYTMKEKMNGYSSKDNSRSKEC